MKSTWFGDRRRYDFARCIHDADYSRQFWDLFRDWLEMASLPLQQATHNLMTRTLNEQIEEDYAKRREQVSKPEKFAEAFGILVMALEENRYDFLGSVMQEMEINDMSGKGQCFTPKDLCQLMVQMQMGDIDPQQWSSRNRLMIDEPCCGGGAMSIACAKFLMEQKGMFPWQFWIRCTDVDWRCWAMCYIQMTLIGAPAEVIWGNTLTLETWKGDVTLVGVMHPRRHFTPDDPVDLRDIESVPAESVSAGEQLSLFA